ncbi:hypothetical protein [Embleya sp. NPDC059259]|uniref:hypothetical protein n=1 Tax=unclassified Embleya TaxID=2699296 RepID=UPI0036CFD908
MDDETSTELTVQEQCVEMGRVLGIEGPVTETVLRAALDDATYVANLLTCRRDPVLLRYLLDRPPARANEPTGADMLARGAAALARWARTGFTVVDDETRNRRLAACGQCPELRPGPEGGSAGALLTITGVRASDKSVCGKCGCPVSRKTRLPSESCPSPHPQRPGTTRWEEPAEDAARPSARARRGDRAPEEVAGRSV